MHALATFALAADAAGKAAATVGAAADSSAGGGSASAIWAFALLVASLVVFIVSTRQLPLLQRALIWSVGASFLVVSGFLSVSSLGTESFPKAVVDMFARGAESTLWQAFVENAGFVRGYISPLLNVLFVLSSLVALGTLIAFTPGEGVERLMRPLIFVVGGGALGGLLALVIVATGYGGYPKRNLFFGIVSEKEIVDGDTLWLGGVKMRLAGIDAPEDNQTCLTKGISWRCGDAAKAELLKLVDGDQVLVCMRHREMPKDDPWGRPIVSCTSRPKAGGEVLLAESLAEAGFAVVVSAAPNKLDEEYTEKVKNAASRAKNAERQIWASCMLSPKVWRDLKAPSRKRFEQADFGEWKPDDFVDYAKCLARG